MGLVNSPKECLVCLNSIDMIYVPNEESQNFFNICCSYVKDAINIEFLINNIIGNNNRSLSFCKNCLEFSNNLCQLVEQLSKIKKEINDLSNTFSETITKQRIQATANNAVKQFSNENKKIRTVNIHKSNWSSSDKPLFHELTQDSEQDSFIHSEASNKIDEYRSEIVKTESDGLFPNCEDECCIGNVFDNNEEEGETNCLVTEEGENEVDPFGDIESKPIFGSVNNFSKNIIKSEPPIVTAKTASELVSSITMPNIVLKRIRKDGSSNRVGLLNPTNTTYQDKAAVNFAENVSCGRGANDNSRTEKTKQKKETRKKGRKKYRHDCPICQKRFNCSSDLQRHLVIHTGERPYRCAVCDKPYKQAKDLRIHERIHTGEKPYKCLMCEKSFTRLDTLKRHEKNHSMEKQYKCSSCELSFRRKGVLKIHEKTHIMKQPY